LGSRQSDEIKEYLPRGTSFLKHSY
jgi:hypothetical protein